MINIPLNSIIMIKTFQFCIFSVNKSSPNDSFESDCAGINTLSITQKEPRGQ